MFAEISKCLSDYLEADENLTAVDDRLEALKQPERPLVVSSEQELADYWKEYNDWDARRLDLEQQRNHAVGDRATANDALKAALPEGNIWFKVNARNREWAVGKRGDDWGGWHIVVEIRSASDNLYPLRDRYH